MSPKLFDAARLLIASASEATVQLQMSVPDSRAQDGLARELFDRAAALDAALKEAPAAPSDDDPIVPSIDAPPIEQLRALIRLAGAQDRRRSELPRLAERVSATLAGIVFAAEKPIPDAPGWWACPNGDDSDLVRVVAHSDGSLHMICAGEDHDSVPLDPKWDRRWYGPIALPWEGE